MLCSCLQKTTTKQKPKNLKQKCEKSGHPEMRKKSDKEKANEDSKWWKMF